MSIKNFSTAAQQYLARRVTGTKAQCLPESERPTSIEDALAVHQEMIKQRSDTVGGWKCLLPLGEDKIIVAPIFSNTVQSGDVCHLMMDKNVARIEPEIVFMLNKDLPARAEDYSEQEIDDAIGGCYMALELMQSRFHEDAGNEFAESLADCMLNQGLFIGPEIDKALAYAAAEINITVTQTEVEGDDTVKVLEGKHPNPLPQLPVYWLINFMSKRGTSFKKGEAITTGSYKGIVEVDFDKPTEIVYEGLGKYNVEFKTIEKSA